MKKQFLLIVILLLNVMLLNSQVVNHFNENTYSQLRILFFPTLNKEISFLEINNAQRYGVPPTPGFVIYNTSSKSFEYFNGMNWFKFNPNRIKPPLVTTTIASGITGTQAISGGTIKSDDVAITARGICWSTHEHPTIADSITSDGSGVGNYSSHMKGLMGNTSYFVRAYAKSTGINYGNEISFKTLPYNLICQYGVDSVTLKIEDYHSQGSVEWQESLDSVHWTTIPGAVNDMYQLIPGKTQYYRALISSKPTKIILVDEAALLKYVSMPKNLTPGDISVIEDFDALTEWSISDGNGSLALDSEHSLQGNNSIKILLAAGTSTAMQKEGPFDLSSFQVVRLWYYIPEVASVTGVAIQLSQSNYAKFAYFQGAPYKKGWNSFEVQRAGFQHINGVDWNAPFDKIKVILKQNGTGIVWASIDRIEGITQATIPAVCINFDDGNDNVFTNAFPIMQARKIRATSYIVTSYVGQQGILTWDQCRIMNNAGWDMGSHTHTHPNLTLLTEAEIDKELNTSRDILIAQGLPKAASFVAYPFGSNNDIVLAHMATNHMILGRCVISHYLTSPPNFNYTIETRNIANTTSLAEVKAAIDKAITGGNILSLLFHNIVEKPVGATDWSIADFKELMDYIVLKQIQPLTITQYNELITNKTNVYKLAEP
ncbi:MAG: polysaccharide deacetylase family protein [Bacteroidales bacterium]